MGTSFILDRTLTPAIETFGFREVRMIDPTCGSGHFLLGGFARLVAEWQRNEPVRNAREIAQKALDSVAGVDLNPFAVAIARFRLLVAALQVSEVRRLSEAPDFRIHVAIGDSLLHGTRFGLRGSDEMFAGSEHYAGTSLAHAYASEDLMEVQRILGLQYHAVVGNPPYITVKDKALNTAYRQRYVSCHMKYSLGAPFTERFFELAITGREAQPSGFVGQITANSFMKREFGSKLIEEVLPTLDLTHVVDTSGAYIPGHGTPTVLLFGRHRAPVGDSVRTVMGIKGEPSTPDDAALGLVWSAILAQIDLAGSESEFVSVADTPRSTFAKHPWSIAGGGATELKEIIESDRPTLRGLVESIGITAFTLEDDVYVNPAHVLRRYGVGSDFSRPMVSGDELRDWIGDVGGVAIFPYNENYEVADLLANVAPHRFLWPYRTVLANNKMFGDQTKVEAGLKWWEFGRLTVSKFRSPLSINFAEIASHNHFILDRGGKVFKQTAPVIKLPSDSTEDQHLGLLGLLNSSVAGFWLKQVSHQKQMMGGDGIRISDRSKVPYQFASTRVQEFPLPTDWQSHPDRLRLVELARQGDALARVLTERSAAATITQALRTGQDVGEQWEHAQTARRKARSELILIQEEIDFLVYHMYSLVDDRQLLSTCVAWDVEVEAGQRPFCILQQKNLEGFAVPATVPDEWPVALRELWNRRIQAIKMNASLRVIEDAHYKRRWIGRQGLFNHGARADEFKDALAAWMLDRLESSNLWHLGVSQPPQIATSNRLAESVRLDADFVQIATLFAGHADFDLDKVVSDLVTSESVPFLSVLRYKESGLRKRAQWEETWALQRREDSGEDVGQAPVPPKYEGKDYLKSDIARLRGSLDVPKERWVSFPGCERGADTSLPIAWAGWNHLQQATALAGYYVDMKDTEGWEPARLQPLLAGLLELVPWLEQWHNNLDPVFGERMGTYYKGFVAEEARTLGFTLDDLRAWKPAVVAAKRGRRRAS